MNIIWEISKGKITCSRLGKEKTEKLPKIDEIQYHVLC